MTTQFTLRPLDPSDADWIFDACQDAEILKWTEIPRPYLKQHAIDFATTLSGDLEVWVIESNRPLGVIGVHSINPITRIADIGYWCAPWGRRQGAISNGLAQFIAKMKPILMLRSFRQQSPKRMSHHERQQNPRDFSYWVQLSVRAIVAAKK